MKLRLTEINKTGDKIFNAGSKAVTDVDALLAAEGYGLAAIEMRSADKNAIVKKVQRLLDLLRLRRQIAKADELFVQFPLYTFKEKPGMIKFILSRFKGKLNIIVHDIPGYKNAQGLDEAFRVFLPWKPRIIAHTPAMARMIEKDCSLSEGSVNVLDLFDYLTADKADEPNPDGKTVIYAGNLKDCPFVSRLAEIPELDFNVYGVHSPNVVEGPNCHYCGKFSPEQVSAIKGDWGLVWHGPDLETSAGNIGEYLRIISSHKISLYLAACKPVILWDESSVADFIIANKLGIAVKSMFDIPAALDALSENEKAEIAKNVKIFSKKLRNSEMLKKHL